MIRTSRAFPLFFLSGVGILTSVDMKSLQMVDTFSILCNSKKKIRNKEGTCLKHSRVRDNGLSTQEGYSSRFTIGHCRARHELQWVVNAVTGAVKGFC